MAAVGGIAVRRVDEEVSDLVAGAAEGIFDGDYD
jgi:hypothetical protein